MNIYVLSTEDTSRFEVRDSLEEVAPDDTYVSSDLNPSSGSRKGIMARWQPVSLKGVFDGKPDSRCFADIHSYSRFTGLNYVISERCKEAIENEFPGVCSFLRLSFESAPHLYWGLWANNVIDAIDTSNSDLTNICEGFSMLGRRMYRRTVIDDCPIFRLPPEYGGEWDQVTDDFVDMVKRHQLTNFSFWDRNMKG